MEFRPMTKRNKIMKIPLQKPDNDIRISYLIILVFTRFGVDVDWIFNLSYCTDGHSERATQLR